MPQPCRRWQQLACGVVAAAMIAACQPPQRDANSPTLAPTRGAPASATPDTTSAALPAGWPTLDADAPLPDASTIDVDGTDSWSVAEAAVRIIFTRNAVTEPGYSDSYRRAAALFTDRLADLYTQSGSQVRTVQPWTDWFNEGASVAVRTNSIGDERPPATDVVAYEIVRVVEYPTSAAGEPLQRYQSAHYVTLRRDDAGQDWKIDELTIGTRNAI